MTSTLERWFQLKAHGTKVGTEVRAGLTTFMVMAYIIFVNPIILGYVGVPGLDGKGLPFGPTLTVTCLTAGLLSIAMGAFTNYPLALAPGMGLNAVVAFELVAGRGLTWPQAMTIVFFEGVVITILVLTRFREAMLEAVPLSLKRAISVGIGLFIAFIGFFTAGFVVKPAARAVARRARAVPGSADRGVPDRLRADGVADGPSRAGRAAARHRGHDHHRDRPQRRPGGLEGLPHAGRSPAADRGRAAAGLLDLRAAGSRR